MSARLQAPGSQSWPLVASRGYGAQGHRVLLVRAEASTSTPTTVDRTALLTELDAAIDAVRRSPQSMRLSASAGVKSALEAMKQAGAAPKWGLVAAEGTPMKRRNVFQGELRQVGIKAPDKIGVPSIRNDAAFLATVVVSASVLAVLAGTLLPGDWGFFSSYLIGSIILVVMGIGSTAPGLLQVVIDKFSMVFPDYRERVVRHEAAHLLLGYLLGVPVTGYSLELGKEHTEFAEAKIQKRIIERNLEDEEIDQLALVAVAGMAAEGQMYEEVMGQNADLVDLQRLLLRSRTRLSDQQQQNITRWAVYVAGSLLRQYKKEHEALIAAMSRGAPVSECVQAIETAA